MNILTLGDQVVKKIMVYKILPIIGIAVILLVGIAYHLDRFVSTFAANVREKGANCIVIDAGHGGVDGGAVSCTGVYESHINLQIALRLNDLLHFLGYRTVMIRTEDISVYTNGNTISEKKVSDLKERVRKINSIENCILISIHQNYFQDGRYSGAQIFHNKKGEKIAKLIQDRFCSSINIGSRRKSKTANGIYLMERVRCPGILIECGFLSNKVEESNLRNAEYQKKVCCVIASGLSEYLNLESLA